MSPANGRPSAASPATPNSARVRDSPKAIVIWPQRDSADNILHERAQGAASPDSSNPRNSYPAALPNRRTEMSRPRGGVSGEPESSADEETSIVRRAAGQNINYQSTTTQKKPLRSHPSTASIRRTGRVYQGGDQDHANMTDENESWWARLLSEYGSIELENKGSVARDHLALERTFLAWLRTSLAFASIGIAITQLFRLNVSAIDSPGETFKRLRHIGKPLGATFLSISILMLAVGFHRYFESQHWIIRGKFPAGRGSVALVAFITFALMVTSLVVVVSVGPREYEKR